MRLTPTRAAFGPLSVLQRVQFHRAGSGSVGLVAGYALGMAATSVSIDLPAPPDTVWAVVTDLPRLGEWVTTHKDFPSPPPERVAEGTTFEQEMTLAGASMTIHWTAARVEAPRELVWQGDGPVGSTATTRYRLEDADGGTRFTFDTEYALPGGPLGRVAGAAAKGHGESEARASLERLRTLCETGVS